MNIRAMRFHAGADGWQRLFQRHVSRLAREEGYRGIQLVGNIDEMSVGMLRDMARAGTCRQRHAGRLYELAIPQKRVLGDPVEAEIGNQHRSALRYLAHHMGMRPLLPVGDRAEWAVEPRRCRRRRKTAIL